MIERKVGNLLDVTEGFIVHGCNSKGVMGKGVALSIKNKWPQVFNEYRKVYENQGKLLYLGTCVPVRISDKLVVVNAITQKCYAGCPGSGNTKRFVSYGAILDCFNSINNFDIVYPDVPKQLHFPEIGAGLGGGDWSMIADIIDQSVHNFSKTVWVLP